jgi:hypothetical protein
VCRFSLRYRFDDKTGKALPQPFEVPEPDEIYVKDWARIPERILELQGKVLRGRREDLNLAFSPSEVVVQIEGSDLPDLVIKDMPGLIQNGDSSDIDSVRRMTSQSVKAENAIIMLCAPCDDDIDNQEAMKLVAQADPKFERTIGVLTKPDRIQKGTEAPFLDILLNKHEKAELRHGWFVLRCPSQEEIKRNGGFDRSAADEAEIKFLAKKCRILYQVDAAVRCS